MNGIYLMSLLGFARHWSNPSRRSGSYCYSPPCSNPDLCFLIALITHSNYFVWEFVLFVDYVWSYDLIVGGLVLYVHDAISLLAGNVSSLLSAQVYLQCSSPCISQCVIIHCQQKTNHWSSCQSVYQAQFLQCSTCWVLREIR